MIYLITLLHNSRISRECIKNPLALSIRISPTYEAHFENDPETLFPNEFYEGGKYIIKWNNGLKLHKTSQLRSTDLIFPQNRYKPIQSGRQISYDELLSDIKPLNRFNVELRYVPWKEWIIFEYVNINQTKSEHIQFDLTEKIEIDSLEISTKIKSLCDCKTGNQ